MTKAHTRIASSVPWDSREVYAVDGDDRVFFVIGHNGSRWKMTMRDKRGGCVPFPDGRTESDICKGNPGDFEFEDEGDGFLLVSVPVGSGDGEHVRDMFSDDGGATWAPYYSDSMMM